MQYSIFNVYSSKKRQSSNLIIDEFRQVPPTVNKTLVQGFTLVELMITIAVASIIIAIALPNLGSFTTKLRVDNEVTTLHRLLLNTRSEAISSGVNATLCPLKSNDTCDNITVWTGRIGIITINGLIKERKAIQSGDKLDFTFSNVTYNPTGQLSNDNIGSFNYCPKDYTDYSRAVFLGLSGRAYLSSDINGDGRDQDRNNNNIVCI